MSRMSKPDFRVRLMVREDVPVALDIWRETGMQEGTNCLYTWLQVDAEAFHVAELDTGEVIAICGAVIHNSDFAFVGIYAVREKYRGLGVGKEVWDACMDHIGTRNAALNAVPDKLELYRDRAGFSVPEPDWACVVNETEEPVDHEVLSDTLPSGVELESFEDSLLDLMFEYDLALAGYDRSQALELNCKEPDSRTLVAVREGKCVGFGTIKESCHGAGQVGPLYADDPDVAEVILRRLLACMPRAKGLVLMTVSTNRHANDFARRLSCPATEECPRLYRKRRLDLDVSKVYGNWDLNFAPI